MSILDKIKGNKNQTEQQEENNTPQPTQDNTRIIAIASGKGGVGKSNISVNLGLLLQQQNMSTLLIDADFGMANIDILLGITPQYNLSHIIKGKCNMEDAIINGPRGLDILPGTSGVDTLINMSSVAIKRLLNTSDYIEEKYDIVIIDIGAGIHHDVTNFIKASDEVIVVLTPEPTAIMDAYSLIKVLNNKNYNENINLLINQVNSQHEGKQTEKKLKNAIKQYLKFDVNTMSYIPFDRKLRKAVKKQKPVTMLYPNSKASRSLQKTADYILERKRKDHSRGMKGFVYKMVGLFTN